MKKIMLVVIILMAIVLILGLSWGKLFKRGYTQDEYGIELAMRDQKIEQLEDSIRIMRAFLTTLREYFARVKMFMDLLTTDTESITKV